MMETKTSTSQQANVITIATTAPQVPQYFSYNNQPDNNNGIGNSFKMIAICYAGLFISFGLVTLIAYSAGYPVTW